MYELVFKCLFYQLVLIFLLYSSVFIFVLIKVLLSKEKTIYKITGNALWIVIILLCLLAALSGLKAHDYIATLILEVTTILDIDLSFVLTFTQTYKLFLLEGIFVLLTSFIFSFSIFGLIKSFLLILDKEQNITILKKKQDCINFLAVLPFIFLSVVLVLFRDI